MQFSAHHRINRDEAEFLQRLKDHAERNPEMPHLGFKHDDMGAMMVSLESLKQRGLIARRTEDEDSWRITHDGVVALVNWNS